MNQIIYSLMSFLDCGCFQFAPAKLGLFRLMHEMRDYSYFSLYSRAGITCIFPVILTLLSTAAEHFISSNIFSLFQRINKKKGGKNERCSVLISDVLNGAGVSIVHKRRFFKEKELNYPMYQHHYHFIVLLGEVNFTCLCGMTFKNIFPNYVFTRY